MHLPWWLTPSSWSRGACMATTTWAQSVATSASLDTTWLRTRRASLRSKSVMVITVSFLFSPWVTLGEEVTVCWQSGRADLIAACSGHTVFLRYERHSPGVDESRWEQDASCCCMHVVCSVPSPKVCTFSHAPQRTCQLLKIKHVEKCLWTLR